MSKIGVTSVIHTWGQTLCEHCDLHCIVTGGGIAIDGTRWTDAKRKRMFDSKALAIVFRGKYLAGMQLLGENGDLEFHGSGERLREAGAFRLLLNEASRKKWVVYSKLPFAGPEQVLINQCRKPSPTNPAFLDGTSHTSLNELVQVCSVTLTFGLDSSSSIQALHQVNLTRKIIPSIIV